MQSHEAKMNIAIINKEQLWQRNKDFKNWGSYRPFWFKQGQPRIIIPNLTLSFYYFLAQLFFLWLLIADFTSEQLVTIKEIVRLLIWIVANIAFYNVLSTDLGIASTAEPLINLQEMSQYANFCMECKCIQTLTAKHCRQCSVCIEGSHTHLSLSKMCITNKNYLSFTATCLMNILQAILMLF